MTEHAIKIKSKQIWRGWFDNSFIDTDGTLDDEALVLQFDKEVSEVYTCTCGKKFYKQQHRVDHVIDQQ